MKADDLILISVDDHIAEPPDMFDAHVPATFKEFAPQVVDDGVSQRWWYMGKPGRDLGLNAVAGKPREHYNVDAYRYDQMRDGCWNVRERVRDMNAGGQLAGLNFPNFTGFAGQVLNQGPDREINLVMIKAYNDWHVDEWCGAYPGRFIPCGILPLFDPDEAAKEIRRLALKGCHAVTFSENPEALNMPTIHSGAWDPVFGAASDAGTVLCTHVGSSSRGSQVSSDAPASTKLLLSSVASTYTLGDLLYSDIWRRFPDLRFSLTEGDIGWIPYLLYRAEHVLDRHSGWTKQTVPYAGGPREVFQRHILCCFINDPVGVEMMHHFNTDNVCWEADYPHSDGTWPTAPEQAAAVLAPLSDELIAKITHENAMRHFQFDPFTTRPRERCTAAALRAESPDVDLVTHVGRAADERDLDAWRRITSGAAATTKAST